MDPLLPALMAVDELHGSKEQRRLARGWMGWESKLGRRGRSRLARALRRWADRLFPAAQPLASGGKPASSGSVP